MKNDLTSCELLGRFLGGEPTPADLLEVSSRLAVVLADVGTKFRLLDRESTTRPLLLQAFRDTTNAALQRCLRSQSPAERISVASILPSVCPELIFPLGYDEVRFGCAPVEDDSVSESMAGVLDEIQSALPEQENNLASLILLMQKTTHFRSPDGVWHDWEGLFDALLPPQEEPGRGERRSENEWVGILSDRWVNGIAVPRAFDYNVLSLPQLWIPPSYGDTQLHVATKSILRNLHESKIQLAELHWRTLEEIVAELLHDVGLQVAITERSGDGGRDVIGRGELIPGEPTLLAVEVKHRAVVPVSEVRQAMWANRHFPALLFVTSGRFSAGVYRERQEKEGVLRLFLKDGHGLSQWMAQYAHRNFESAV